ncbi:hypothetical protein [Salaquimonas pukyongi]|uniref:hypothetical protein n=1 Tax=Salaquimonas pukyongi TaxID=2712698 RepID=UPI0012EC0BE2|nr:hypothetical protein [Salaquimonas pukyongi]
MRELLTVPEGTISRAEFRRGAVFLILLCAGLVLLSWAAAQVNRSMAWMTVAVVPFMGLLVFSAACSIVYFWYCLFAKRLRAMSQQLHLLHAMLGALVLGGAALLADYQNRTLSLANDGLLAQAGNLAVLAIFAGGLFFLILLGMGWFGPDHRVPPGNCLAPGQKPAGTKTPDKQS